MRLLRKRMGGLQVDQTRHNPLPLGRQCVDRISGVANQPNEVHPYNIRRDDRRAVCCACCGGWLWRTGIRYGIDQLAWIEHGACVSRTRQ